MARVRLLPLLLLLLPGCPDSHGYTGDAGGDAGGCGTSRFPFCVTACGSDFGVTPVCTREGWECPPPSFDSTMCTSGTCPADIEPWNPDAPGNACSVEGASCSNSGGVCGGGMFCTCNAGRWNCGVAEPDPVCWCGREPSEGDPCSMEGATCGACCPTPGSPDWPLMFCSGGRWTSGACPAIECPPIEPVPCPADTRSVLGQSCPMEGQACGDSCCDTAIDCRGGVWTPGPVADCFACLSFACGPTGSCPADQACQQSCGPDDGTAYTCTPLPDDCRDCSCVSVPPEYACRVEDGHVFFDVLTFCG